MGIDFGSKHKTIIGMHNRKNNSFSLVENKFPLPEDDNHSLFLLTRNHFFSIANPQVEYLLTSNPRYEKFEQIKNTIANILVIPGLVIAAGYILKSLRLLENYPPVLRVLNLGITNALFGISVLALIILWHDFYSQKSKVIKLPKITNIPQKDFDEIKAVGFKFGRYARNETVNYLSDETIDYLEAFTEKSNLNTLLLYKDLLTNNYEVQQLIRRSGIELNAQLVEEAGITTDHIPNLSTSSLCALLIYALQEALTTNSDQILPEHIFLAITKIFPALQKLLQKNNININILREVVEYWNYRDNKKARPLNPDYPYFRTGGIGEPWIYGWTFVLSHFSKDMNLGISKSNDIFGIGHEQEVENLVSTLGKISNKNALMVGDAGVGKSSIILGVAQKINHGDVPIQLKDKKIIELDINQLIAYSQNQANMEEVIIKSMTELANAGNTILYIDEIQEIIPRKAGESGHSIAGIMLPFILNSKFPIVGSINYSDYKKYFYSNESLRQSFTNIEVQEITAGDALYILETKIDSLEQNFNCYITFPALVSAVELAQRYVKERKLPSSAVQTLEATCSWAQANGIQKITSEHVAKAISLQKNINITEIDQEESNKMMKLEENIKHRVVGQDEAIITISEALRRARADVRNPNKPIGSFLFVGPTGVGKTYLAKVVAEEYFGKDDMIRLDMSEYQEVSSIERFLGSTGSESIFGQTQITLIDRIKSNPHTVVLFDEIEKAHPNILDLLLQLLDEGRLTSASGETTDFTNAIIVCTSNIGSKILLDSLSESNVMWEEAKERVLLEVRQSFRPEFLNRYDAILVFEPHDIKNLTEIAVLELNEVAKRLANRDITIKWSNQIPMLIANKSNEPGLGARPMKRYIQDSIEGNIAKGIIEQTLKAGDEVEIKESWIQ